METNVETPVTTSGGAGTAPVRTSRTPASAAPVTDLLLDPGRTRRVMVLALAQISLVEAADVAVTGVGKGKAEIALQIPYPHLDHPR